MSAKRLNLLAVQEEMQQLPSSAEADLDIAKEHFDKLKFNFVELTTKQLFMDKVGEQERGEGGV